MDECCLTTHRHKLTPLKTSNIIYSTPRYNADVGGSTCCRSCYSKQDRAVSGWLTKGENRESMYSSHLAPSWKITYSCVFHKCSSFVDDLNINLTSVFVGKIKQNCTNSNNYVRSVIFILQK